jgi:predicted RNA binding protein YcfA (HicA-like mRNA interferase family)
MPPKLPRDLSQDEVVRALVNAGGIEERSRGKGSHRLVRMPDIGRPVVVPAKIKTGLLGGIIREAGLALEEFLDAL